MTNARDKANIPVLNFQSKGIDDNADATAITIDSSENVGINTTIPSTYYSNKLVIDCGSASQSGLTIRSESSKDGMISFADGTVGATRYSGFIIYDHDDDEFRIATNGSEKMRILSGGNVGIGTSSPNSASNLQVGDTYANDPRIRIETTDGGNKRLDLYVSDGHGYVTSTQSAQNLNLASRVNLIFKTDTSSERMRIDSSGNVGIGTTTPSNFNASARQLVVGSGSGDNGITIFAGNTNNSSLFLADGTVGTNGYRGSVNYLHNGDALTLHANATETMRLSNGKVGIGTTTLTYALNISESTGNMRIKTVDSANVANASTSLLEFHGSNNRAGYAGFVGGDMVIHTDTHSAGDIKLQTNGAERMRFLSNGRICINRTSSIGAAKLDISHPGSSEYGLTIDSSNTSGTQYHLDIRRGGTQAGYIASTNATTVTLANASDERLKENIENSGSAIQDIKDLKVRQFDWKDNIDTHKDFGFVAQELHSIIPEAVAVGSDELDDNGKPKQSWGVDYSHIVPRLVKAVQEQQTKIESLEAEVTALKNQP